MNKELIFSTHVDEELTLTIVWDGRLGSVSMGGQFLCNGDANTTEDFIIPYSTIRDLTAEIRAYKDGVSGWSVTVNSSSVNIEYLRTEHGIGYSYEYYRIIDITKSAVLVL